MKKILNKVLIGMASKLINFTLGGNYNTFSKYNEISFISDSGKNVTYHITNNHNKIYNREALEKNINDVYNDLSNMGFVMPQEFNFSINRKDDVASCYRNRIKISSIGTYRKNYLSKAIRHEMMHMAQQNTTSKPIARWLAEGHARYYQYDEVPEKTLSIHPESTLNFSFYSLDIGNDHTHNYSSGCIATEYLIKNGVDMIDFYKLVDRKGIGQALTSSGFTTQKIDKHITEKVISNIKNYVFSLTKSNKDSNGNLISRTTINPFAKFINILKNPTLDNPFAFCKVFEEFDPVTGNKIVEEIRGVGTSRHRKFENGVITYELHENNYKSKSETKYKNGNKISTTRTYLHGDKSFTKFNPLTGYETFIKNTYKNGDTSETTFNRNPNGDLLSSTSIGSDGSKKFAKYNPLTSDTIFIEDTDSNGDSSKTIFNLNFDDSISTTKIKSDGSIDFENYW